MSDPMDIDNAGLHEDEFLDQPPLSEADTPRATDVDPPPPRRIRAMDEQVEQVKDDTAEIVQRVFFEFLEK